jgi:DNA modification methylase
MYCGDCLEILPTLQTGSVDAVVTSPPYNVGGNNMAARAKVKYGEASKDALVKSEWEFLVGTATDECLRIASLVFLNVQSCASNKQSVARIIGERAESLKERIVWVKYNPPPAMEPGVLDNAFEDIFVLSSQSADKRKFYGARWRGCLHNVITTPVFSNNEFADVHRALFPIEIPLFCIKVAGNPQTILDPFAGLCTTALACIKTGRKFVGIEKSPRYFEIAKNRIEAELNAQPLFSEVA